MRRRISLPAPSRAGVACAWVSGSPCCTTLFIVRWTYRRVVRSQNHYHHRVIAQLAIQRVELRARSSVDGAGNTQILAVLARFHAHRSAIEVRCVALHDFEHGLRKTGARMSHDLEWKLARVFDERCVFPA